MRLWGRPLLLEPSESSVKINSPSDLIRSSSSTPASCTVVFERATASPDAVTLMAPAGAPESQTTGEALDKPWACRAASVALMLLSRSPGLDAAIAPAFVVAAGAVGAGLPLPPPPQAPSKVSANRLAVVKHWPAAVLCDVTGMRSLVQRSR